MVTVEGLVALAAFAAVQAVGVAAIYWLVEENATDRARTYAVVFLGFGWIGYSITGSFGGAGAIQICAVLLLATVLQVGRKLLFFNADARR